MRAIFVRVFAVSFLAALILAGVSLLVLSGLSGSISRQHRTRFLSLMAHTIEKNLTGQAVTDLTEPAVAERLRQSLMFMPPGPPPPGSPPGPPPPNGPPHEPPGHANVWLVGEDGRLLFSQTPGALPPDEWREIPKPEHVHESSARQSLWPWRSDLALYRIEASPTVYLLFNDDHRPMLGPLFFAQGALTFATVLIALFGSLSITMFYLRRKSVEARAVLARLEAGDLKARFDIQSFDQFGGLMLDFNRMSQAIEHLVNRVRSTEAARKNLLEELGHDLRTPLTSLSTSLDTFHSHIGALSEEQRASLLAMMQAEVHYLRELVEQLMTIASLQEPSFQMTASEVDVTQLLETEISHRRQNVRQKLSWDLAAKPMLVRGDAHLLQRLFKNALDNSARFAKGQVRVRLEDSGSMQLIVVEDDGPGLSPEALLSFGTRQGRRTIRHADALDFSLGLGSVIMRAIAETHQGFVEIENRPEGGARLTIRLPQVETPANKS